MKLINYADADWLVGDEAADLLLQYSILMAREGSADAVEVKVLTAEGTEQAVSFLLGPATMMTARSVDSDLPEPENSVAIEDVRRRMDAITSPPPVLPTEAGETISDYDL